MDFIIPTWAGKALISLAKLFSVNVATRPTAVLILRKQCQLLCIVQRHFFISEMTPLFCMTTKEIKRQRFHLCARERWPHLNGSSIQELKILFYDLREFPFSLTLRRVSRVHTHIFSLSLFLSTKEKESWKRSRAKSFAKVRPDSRLRGKTRSSANIKERVWRKGKKLSPLTPRTGSGDKESVQCQKRCLHSLVNICGHIDTWYEGLQCFAPRVFHFRPGRPQSEWYWFPPSIHDNGSFYWSTLNA